LFSALKGKIGNENPAISEEKRILGLLINLNKTP